MRGGWLRRFAGILLFPTAWWFYNMLNARTSFVCDRDAGVCTFTAERAGAPPSSSGIPLADVLGALYERMNRNMSPRAGELLAKARTLGDVDVGEFYGPDSSSGKGSGSGERLVIWTRRGVVHLTPHYMSRAPSGVDTSGFNSYIEDRKPGRFELVIDESQSAIVSATLTCLLGVVLVVLPHKGLED